jgi:hypothetical protein
MDLTAILKLIEQRFSLAALTGARCRPKKHDRILQLQFPPVEDTSASPGAKHQRRLLPESIAVNVS